MFTKTQVSWDLLVCRLVRSSRLSKVRSASIFRVGQSKNKDCLTLKKKAIRCFKKLDTARPATQCHLTEDLQHRCDSPNSVNVCVAGRGSTVTRDTADGHDNEPTAIRTYMTVNLQLDLRTGH